MLACGVCRKTISAKGLKINFEFEFHGLCVKMSKIEIEIASENQFWLCDLCARIRNTSKVNMSMKK